MRFYRPAAAAAMTLLLLACFALAEGVALKPVGVPKSNKSEAISLPEDREIGSKTRVVTIQAEVKDAKSEVQWVVFNLNDENPVEALASDKTLLVFPNDQEDVIVILAYTAVDGKPAPAVRTVIRVSAKKKDDKEEPKPGPRPTPKPAGAAVKHVSFVLDFSKQTPQIAAVVTDANLRKYLSDNGVEGHVVSTKSKSVTEDGLVKGLEKAGGAPAVVLQDAEGNILEAVRLTDAAAVKALVEKHKEGN